MAKSKPRWAELNGGSLCFVDSDGMILARVQFNVLDQTYRYHDKEFIDSRSAMKHVEKEKFSETE
jgi:hypothetical protein